MVWLFMGTAERCLVRIQGLVVNGNVREWQTVIRELREASARIHAEELAALCKRIGDGEDDAVSRMGSWLQVKEAYEGLVVVLRNADLLNRASQGD